MNKSTLICSFLLITIGNIRSQIHVDMQAGYSPASNPTNTNLIVNRQNPLEEFQFNMIQVDPQLFAGIRLNVELNAPFFLEGGVSYTERTSSYMIDYTLQRETEDVEVMKETENVLLVPFNIGVGLGSVDITSGLALNQTISKSGELSHLKGFHADHNQFNVGFQMGVRYAFQRVMAGVEYQGKLQRACRGMYVHDQSLEVRNVPSQFVFTLQYRIQ